MDSCLSSAPDAACASPDPRTPLTPRQLLALQLLARGYSLRQLAALAPTDDPGGVLALLKATAAALGVRTAPAAIAEAKRRGLLD